MLPAWGASMRNTSSPADPVTVTAKAVPCATWSSLSERSLTLVTAVVPSRVKVAVPLASTLMSMAPVALPSKLTTPLVSVTLKVG